MKSICILPCLALLLVCSLIACSDSDPAVQTAHQELMDLHDETMKLMSPAKKSIKSLKDIDQPSDAQLQALESLTEAEDQMWNWMHTWEKPHADLPVIDKLAHYELWHEKMQLIDEEMRDALAKAEQYVQ